MDSDSDSDCIFHDECSTASEESSVLPPDLFCEDFEFNLNDSHDFEMEDVTESQPNSDTSQPPIYTSCAKGCVSFAGNHRELQFSPQCNSDRSKSTKYHYLPCADRICKLMKSPLLKYLFKYEEHREKDERIISDIYDGSNWKYFSSLMRPTDYFIGLELSWDGFQPDDNAKSIWPLFYSILNYPPCLRGKIH
jgi:hypothetical protein